MSTRAQLKLIIALGLSLLSAPGAALAQSRPAAKPVQKPAPKPAPAPAAPAAPAQPGKPQRHQLMGEWNVYWVSDNRTSKMRVLQAQSAEGITNFSGALGTAGGDACTITGTVVDNFGGQYVDGTDAKTVSIAAYVVARALCDQGQIWIEAFGLPSGKALMSGRATFIAADGRRSFVPIALGR